MYKSYVSRGVSVLAISACAFAAPAFGQTESVPVEVVPADAIELDPITIFATLSPIAAFDYPGQVSVISQEDIAVRQASTLAELFAGVPGVFVDGGSRRSGQSPTIRGIREEDVLVLIDGARQSFVSGHDGRLFIEPELLKSAEVVKGPVSSLYGSGAIGGVIALTTVDAADFLDPGETKGGRVKVGYGSVDNELLISKTAFARTHDGDIDIIGNFTYRESGDIELGNGFTLPDDHEIVSGLAKGTVQIAPGLSFQTSWVRYTDDALTPNNAQGINTGDNVFRDVLSDTVQGTLSYNPADNDWIDGNLQVYWSRNEVEEAEVDSDRVLSRAVETAGVKLDNRSRFSVSDWGKLTLTYGGEYYQDQQTGKDSAPLGSGPLFPGDPFSNPAILPNIPSGTADFAGLFTQAELNVAEPLGGPGELTILPGVRWDSFKNSFDGDEDGFDEIDEQAVSPKIGVSYKPVPWLLLFGNYGEAFRAPSFNEAYATGNHFPAFGPCPGGLCGYNTFIPNPGLKPQDGRTIEAGLGFDFKDVVTAGDTLKLKGSYWQSEVDDFIDLDVVVFGCFDTNPFTPCTSQNVNIANAELDGVEIELSYDSSRFYGKAAFSTIDGRDQDTGAYLGVLQPSKLYFDLGVKIPEYWWRLGTRLTFADDFTKVNEAGQERDGYQTVDLYAVFEPLDGDLKGLRLDFGIDNVTDADYEVVSAGVSEPGINFKAAAAWTYKW